MKLQDFLLSIIPVLVCFFTYPLYCKKETSCNKLLLNWYSILETIVVSLVFCLPWNCNGRKKFCFYYWGVSLGHSLGCQCSLKRGDTWLSSASWNAGLVVLPQESGAAPCWFQLCSGHKALEYRQWPGFKGNVSDQRKENFLLLEKLIEFLFSMKRWGE